MQSRGISEEQCKRLIIEAQLDTVLRNVPDEDLKSEITTYMNKRIAS
jgi:Fe-S cluster assembly scaffold protein SufB